MARTSKIYPSIWDIITTYFEYLATQHKIANATLWTKIAGQDNAFAAVTKENSLKSTCPSGRVVPWVIYDNSVHWKEYNVRDSRGNNILTFWLVPMPGSCAICVATQIDGRVNDARADLFRQQIARHFGYSAMFCTDTVGRREINAGEGWANIFEVGHDRYGSKRPIFAAIKEIQSVGAPVAGH